MITSPDNSTGLTEEELSHTDKIIGIIVSPVKTFENIARYPPRGIDWIMPIIITILFAVISNFVIMNNPNIRYEVLQKQMAQLEKNFNSMVEKGQMSREQANEQTDKIKERIDASAGIGARVSQIVSTIFVVFITFFIISGVYFLFVRFVFGDDGSYQSAMVASGLPYYIGIIAILIMTITSLILERFVSGTSVAAFMGKDVATLTGFILRKLDVMIIWSLAVTGIGFAKMFRADSVNKYIAVMFAIWIAWGMITFFIASAVPMLSFLAM
ncbi:MAG: YIP1 family protein [Ignavibacteria bacterium]